MADEARQRKVADRIQQTVARLLERRIKDPRIGFVTITDARVTGDLQHATVFYTVYGDEAERKGTRVALESAKGLIRSEVGRALGIRRTPTIEFVLDALPQQAASLEQTLASALKRDKKLEEAAANADYAAGEDPYVKPRVDEGEDDEAARVWPASSGLGTVDFGAALGLSDSAADAPGEGSGAGAGEDD